MAKIVGLPKLSPTMEEGTLARWAKKEGDALEIDDLVAEIDTDKATMEWRAFDKGVLLKILVPEGTTLQPEAPVAIIGNKGEDISELLKQVGGGAPVKAAEPAKAETKPEPKAQKAEPAKAEPAKAEPAKAEAKPAAKAPIAEPATEDEHAGGRVFASPFVRKLAREQDVDLRGLRGSGPGGRVVKRDLDEAREAGPAAAAKPAAKAPAFVSQSTVGERLASTEHALSQMRKTIARRLTEAKQTVPHFYLTIDVDADPIWNARLQINADLEKSGEKVSINDLVLKACAIALRRVPAVNRSFAGDKILEHHVVDVSVAVAIPDGLVTPVVRDADRKGVLQIAREVRDLATRAKSKKLKPEEMTGGTFSLSNLGMFGIEEFSAVINPPEGAILAVGAVREEPVVKNGAIVVGRRMKMTMSCDHRVVDGAVGAEWLAALRRLIEAPITLIV